MGLMLTTGGPKVLEYNCRFGDPETQAVLPLLKTDLVDLMNASIDDKLDTVQLETHKDAAVCVVMASGGYPGSYKKGFVIQSLAEWMEFNKNTLILLNKLECSDEKREYIKNTVLELHEKHKDDIKPAPGFSLKWKRFWWPREKYHEPDFHNMVCLELMTWLLMNAKVIKNEKSLVAISKLTLL